MSEITQAIQKGIADYLRSELVPAFSSLVVFEDWPEPNHPLPPLALSCLVQSESETLYHSPNWYKVTVGKSPNGVVEYSYARVECDVQLDIWTTKKFDRDRIAKEVQKAVNRHPASTLGTPGVLSARLERRPGLVLKLTDLLNVKCDYRFGFPQNAIENSEAAQESEWRATFSGTARVYAVAAQEVALLKRVYTNLKVNGVTEVITQVVST